MQDNLSNNEKKATNPNEDSMVTDNMKGKKVDANPDDPKDQPADDSALVTNESQKGKKVDADPEVDKPTTE